MNNEKRQPLYIQIQQYIKEGILKRKYSTNEKLPTENELMEQFGVSRITVANALSELAKEGWIKRIPGRGTFVKNADLTTEDGRGEINSTGSKEKKSSEYNFIALVIPSLEDLFALRIVKGIQEAIEETNYRLTIVLTNNSKELEKHVLRDLIKKDVKGLIIFPADAQTYNEEILVLKINKFPFVLIDRNLPGVETHFVSSDSRLGAQLAVNHLWDFGHRNIVITSDSAQPTMSVSERIAGYMEALRKKGALIDPNLIITDFQVDYSRVDQEHLLYQQIKNRTSTAFIALNARLGLYIKSLVSHMGLRVPEDFSIVTFDEPINVHDHVDGSFTHIDQAEFELGRKSGEILLKVIKNPITYQDKYETILLTPKLVSKSSVTSPPNKVTENQRSTKQNV